MTAKRKKIIYLVTKSNWGGAQKYVYDLSTGLSEEKYEAAVAGGGKGRLFDKIRKAGIKAINLDYLERDINLFREFIVFFKLFFFFLKEKPDIIHLNSSKIGGLGALSGYLANVPKIIFTVHGWPFKEERGLLSIAVIKALSWFTAILSDKVVVLSETEKSLGRKIWIPEKKLIKIHNGVGDISFKNKEDARKYLSGLVGFSSEDKTIIGSVAELHKNKGFDILLPAFAELAKQYPEMILIIFGEGEERKRLETIIKKTGFAGRVLLPGYVSEEPFYLAGFDIFVLPSRKEGLPYAIMEAGLAGLPVVASDVGGINEIIEDMKSGILVRPKSYSELKKAIIFLLENKDKSRHFGEVLREKIKKDFSLKKMLKETERLYN